MNSQRGSAIIMLFIAVALFGMLAFAFMQGSRSNLSMLTSEAQNAQATQAQDCTNVINMAIKRLQARGCGNMISYNGDGSNPNAGAPTNGSCSIYHSNGGGIKNCAGATTSCSSSALQALSVGQACGSTAAYVGVVNGRRIYAALADSGVLAWHLPGGVIVNAVSTTDGLSNTDMMLALDGGSGDFQAAVACRARGPEWYLPTMNELHAMRAEKDTGAFATTYDDNAVYMSSEEYGLPGIDYAVNGVAWQWDSDTTASKDLGSLVRCVRRD